MLIAIYLLLIPVSLGLWIWLTRRIWHVSPAAAGASFFLLVPAIYWCWKLWNVPDARIRVPAIANGVITVVMLLLSYRIGNDELERFHGSVAEIRQQRPMQHTAAPALAKTPGDHHH